MASEEDLSPEEIERRKYHPFTEVPRPEEHLAAEWDAHVRDNFNEWDEQPAAVSSGGLRLPRMMIPNG